MLYGCVVGSASLLLGLCNGSGGFPICAKPVGGKACFLLGVMGFCALVVLFQPICFTPYSWQEPVGRKVCLLLLCDGICVLVWHFSSLYAP